MTDWQYTVLLTTQLITIAFSFISAMENRKGTIGPMGPQGPRGEDACTK